MKRFTIPVLAAGVCSLAIALPQPQQGQFGVGGGLQGPGSRAHVPAPAPQLTAPIVHQGIPGDRIEGGIYVERSVLGEDRLHDLSLGTNPILPVQPGSSTGSDDTYLDGCPCPTGSRFEGEPDCGVGSPCDFADTFNGGCNSAPPVFSPIKLGDVVCGETTYDTGLSCRDTDWYETVLTQTTTVTWTVSGPFDKVVAIIDGSGCPPSVVTILSVPGGCGADASVSATLPAGTWWFFIAPDFTSAVTCGTNYTARLAGGCELYTSAAAFDAANPGLTLEDFEDADPGAGVICTTTFSCLDSTSSDGCIAPGEVAAGLTICSTSGAALAFLGDGAACPVSPSSTVTVGNSDTGSDTNLIFSPPVRSVGFVVQSCQVGGVTWAVDVFGVGGVPILSTTTLDGFWGISCEEPIESITVGDVGAVENELLDNIRFGGTGDCEFITNETQFNARFPGLTLENFEDTSITPGAICGDASPWDETTSNGCISAGEIEAGLTLDSPSGTMLLLAVGYSCGASPVDSNSVGGNTASATNLLFDPPVTRVGLDLETPCVTTETALIEVYGPGAVLISSTTVAITDVQSFLGIACDGLIESVTIVDPTSDWTVLLDNIRYGTGCQVIADADDFDNLYPDLAFEDFEDGNVPSGAGALCGVDPVDSAGDGGTCFDPGDIEPGMALGSITVSGVSLLGDGFLCGGGGNACITKRCAANFFFDSSVLTFSPPVRQVGFDAQVCLGASDTVTVTVFGAGGEVLAAVPFVVSGTSRSFFGISCDRPIARVEILDSPGDGVWLDEIRFGTSKLPFTRFCVEESVASVNTGLKTQMILETQDGAGNLLPFDKSIAGNGSPNRLMMIAKDAPGLGNGGVTNIGYFIMGTGSNTFVPPGSIGPICVAPGIKRYLPPTSMTSETIVFHDAGGTPTTLVAQGFSRVALGAGAHPIGANIGGVLGFHWSFQAWHRDTPGDSNLSDAVAVDFVP